MCTPAAALAAQGAGAVSSAVGSVYAAKSQRSALALQADMSDLQARGALAQGEREQQRSMLQTAQLKGTQRAALAANGVDLGQGSPLNILTTTDTMGGIDAQTIKANALRSAWGYRTQAAADRASASAISPGLAGATSLLTGATAVADSWYRSFKPSAPSASRGDGLSQGERRALGVW